MIITKKIKSDIQKWINALRSGEYSQTTGTLQDADGFCCLGVACKVFIPNGLLKLRADGNLYGALTGMQDYSPHWLKLINIDFGERTWTFKTKNNEDRLTDIVDLNDNLRLSFDEIADCLEAVYILEVMGNDVTKDAV